ncbi:unnamed protein product [Medioppia subpectinata]|uniref:Uncharacterized protein n=1 Tax=Medioppia subpectinata TaxID=1979941 RepID=A0A7R9KIC8_9ACAR|nr:unnamed protein product [Medioppia subpectinata]CAG2104236.1 unnamed protein product [Medioppia subpectinata]
MSSALMVKALQKHRSMKVAALVSSMAKRTLSAGAANPNPNPHGWQSWRDIPDSMIPTSSRRDPNNPIYGTRRYVNFRKKQIWSQIPDGTPVYLKFGAADKVLYYGLIVGTAALVLTNVYHILDLTFGFSKKKKA